MSKEFFPKVTLKKGKILLNAEAVETMELDTPDARVILIENSFPDKPKSPKEILIVKTNGSLCDDLENVKGVFPPEHIRNVKIISSFEGLTGEIAIDDNTAAVIKEDLGSAEEFKLLVCNTESPLAKEFREQWSVTNSYYRLADINDKRACIGKDKAVKESFGSTEEINL